MKNKIVNLTFNFINNYCGLLQAYTLKKYIVDQNFGINFINFQSKHLNKVCQYLNNLNLIKMKPNFSFNNANN